LNATDSIYTIHGRQQDGKTWHMPPRLICAWSKAEGEEIRVAAQDLAVPHGEGSGTSLLAALAEVQEQLYADSDGHVEKPVRQLDIRLYATPVINPFAEQVEQPKTPSELLEHQPTSCVKLNDFGVFAVIDAAAAARHHRATSDGVFWVQGACFFEEEEIPVRRPLTWLVAFVDGEIYVKYGAPNAGTSRWIASMSRRDTDTDTNTIDPTSRT